MFPPVILPIRNSGVRGYGHPLADADSGADVRVRADNRALVDRGGVSDAHSGTDVDILTDTHIAADDRVVAYPHILVELSARADDHVGAETYALVRL